MTFGKVNKVEEWKESQIDRVVVVLQFRCCYCFGVGVDINEMGNWNVFVGVIGVSDGLFLVGGRELVNLLSDPSYLKEKKEQVVEVTVPSTKKVSIVSNKHPQYIEQNNMVGYLLLLCCALRPVQEGLKNFFKNCHF